MTLRAGIYGRNSQGETKSIEDQLALGLRAVAEHGWILAGKYSDTTSASEYRTTERDEWPRLLADLQRGALDVLVLWKSARGSRDAIEWLTMLRQCKTRGVLVHIMADRRTYDPRLSRDWKTLAEDGIASAYFSEELSENVRRGLREAARAGRGHGRVPFGYDIKYDDRGRPVRVPNEHAPIVVEIFEAVAAHGVLDRIANDFNARGVATPVQGKAWRRNTVRTIATNPAYIGIRREKAWGRNAEGIKVVVSHEDHPAQWPALVSERLFWDAHAVLSAPERKTTKPGKVKYLLTHRAQTPCGGVVSRVAGRKDGYPERYQCASDGCVAIVLDEADEIVERVVIARLSLPNARALLLADRSADIARALDDLARYEGQLESARASYERPDGISEEALARKERALAPLIEDARARSRSGDETNALVADLIDARDVEARWRALAMPARRAVVSALATVRVGPLVRYLRKAPREARLVEALARLGASEWANGERWVPLDESARAS